MREFLHITKALADPNRVRILLALSGGELCVCQVVELFQLASSTISKHLSILHHAGLIASRKTERWVYYRLPGNESSVVVREALDWVLAALAKSPETQADRRELKKILKMNPSTICKRQR